VGAASAQGAPVTVKALDLIERTEMSGSEFERENIVAETLSATLSRNRTMPRIQSPCTQSLCASSAGVPPAEGLYDPSLEKDSCGVGFIANQGQEVASDRRRRDQHSLQLEHRGAVGADPRAGDGAGILVQIPHAFFKRKAAEIGFKHAKPGDYAIGAVFMPKETGGVK